MIKKKYMVIALGTASVLLGSLFINNVILAQTDGSEYDPWIDTNDDGIIDVYDIAAMGRAYGTSGEPINKTDLLLNLNASVTELHAKVESLSPRVERLEQTLWQEINSTFYSMQKTPAYIVSQVIAGGITYTCMQSGKTGALEWYSTDAEAVVEACFGNLTSGRTWKETVVLKGNFSFSDTVDIPSYATVHLAGQVIVEANTDFDTFRIWNVHDVEMYGGIIDGNNKSVSAYNDLISIYNSVNVIIRDMLMRNHHHECIVVKGDSHFVTVHDIIFMHIRCCGVYWNSEDASDGTVENCYFYNHWYTEGMYIHGSDRITVSNCVFNKTARNGLGMSLRNGDPPEQINIMGCTFEYCGWQNHASLGLNNGKDVSVVGCTIRKGDKGIYAWGTEGLIIQACTIRETNETAIGLMQTCKDIVITGNRIIDCVENDSCYHPYAIYTSGTITRLLVEGNYIGNEETGKMSVALHGFGVLGPDSRSLFMNNILHNLTGTHWVYINFTDNIIFKNNMGYNPTGQNLWHPFDSISNSVSAIVYSGGSKSPSANTDYTVVHSDIFITCSGGTGVTITIEDSDGNTMASDLSRLSNEYLPVGSRINFGSFETAPTTMIVTGV